jgi:cytochrome c oxidase subunit 3
MQLLEKQGRKHPLINLVNFGLAGVTMLFVTLLVLFALSHPERELSHREFPRIFFLSTIIILAGSYTVERAYKGFDVDNGEQLMNNLLATAGIGAAFSVTQFIGWNQLWTSGITLYEVGAGGSTHTTAAGAFLFVLSGLHVLHLAVGLVFLFMAMFKLVHVRQDAVKAVIYYTDPVERVRIRMLARYWHFLDIIWAIMFMFFLWFFL